MNTSLIKAVLGQSNVVSFQLAAFLAFMLLFALIFVWVYLPGSKRYAMKKPSRTPYRS